MLYVKNMSRPHRVVRLLMVALGAGIMFAGAVRQDMMLPLGVGLLSFALTGLLGWCPMCAMIDRGKPKA